MDDQCCYGHHLEDQLLSYDVETGETVHVVRYNPYIPRIYPLHTPDTPVKYTRKIPWNIPMRHPLAHNFMIDRLNT